MKTPEEIKKGLNVCGTLDGDCDSCAYAGFKVFCTDRLRQDALALIRQLEAELAAAKRERDALFADIKQCNDCYFCKHYGTSLDVEPCQTCILDFQKQDFKPGFEWRGVCPDTEV
jgi:hypothetical protein